VQHVESELICNGVVITATCADRFRGQLEEISMLGNEKSPGPGLQARG
jgi:hypothetical protein